MGRWALVLCAAASLMSATIGSASAALLLKLEGFWSERDGGTGYVEGSNIIASSTPGFIILNNPFGATGISIDVITTKPSSPAGELIAGTLFFTLPGFQTSGADLALKAGNDLFNFSNFDSLGDNKYSIGFASACDGQGCPKGVSNLELTGTEVPLPAALPLLASGLLGLWGIGRLRKSKADVSVADG